jgi:hypothetical protein
MPIRLSCPSCNTGFSLPELPADRRTACPRCGDVFPIRTFNEIVESEGNSRGTALVPGTAKSPRKALARLSLMRATAITLGMGLLGLIAGVAIYYIQLKPKPEPEPEPPPMTAAIPAWQLSSLGYLPADTNIAFAIQPGPVVAYAARMNKEPRELLIQAGIPAKVFDSLTNLGLTLPQVDHIAGGTSFGDGIFTLRLAFVLTLRRPLADEDDFLHKLKARKQNGKAQFDIELGGFPMLLARVSPTIWVFGLVDKDFEAVDRGGYGAGGKQFPAALTQTIAEQIPPNAAAWVATNDEQWAEKPGVKLLIGQFMGKKDWLPVLAKGRAGLVALSLDDSPRFRLFIKTADETTGQQLRTYFQKMAATDDKVRHGGGGELAFLDTPFDPMHAFATLTRFLDAAGGN